MPCRLSSLLTAQPTGAPDLPVLLLVDTAGCDGCEEQQEAEGDSRANEGEAKAVMAHVEKLVAAGVGLQDIGIITPYRAQVRVWRQGHPPIRLSRGSHSFP
jgi:ATP-dependent RNA/DNA helicase IGHMBP2